MWYKIYEESVKAKAETSFPLPNYTIHEFMINWKLKKKNKEAFSFKCVLSSKMNKQRLDGNVQAFLILKVIPACIYTMHT